MEGDTHLIPAHKMCGLWVSEDGWKFQVVNGSDSKRFDQSMALNILERGKGKFPRRIYKRFPRSGYSFKIDKRTKERKIKGDVRTVVYGTMF